VWVIKDWVFLFNNALEHQLQLTKQVTVVRSHPQYFPSLTPYNFYFFPSMKDQLKGYHSSDTVDVQVALKTALQEVTYSDFHKCSKQM
jgi:hypothetical protein